MDTGTILIARMKDETRETKVVNYSTKKGVEMMDLWFSLARYLEGKYRDDPDYSEEKARVDIEGLLVESLSH